MLRQARERFAAMGRLAKILALAADTNAITRMTQGKFHG
jgi:hypothetical protein